MRPRAVAALSLHWVQGKLSAPEDAGGDTGATENVVTIVCNWRGAPADRAAHIKDQEGQVRPAARRASMQATRDSQSGIALIVTLLAMTI
ncbi:MAG: hypothetical protein ACRD2O_18320, partial [Terriglobia bacterium]